MTSKKALGKGLGALIGEGKGRALVARPARRRRRRAEGRLRELPLDLTSA